MDYYSSYKTMCDTSLQQIRRSENKRLELNHKLQKMYQEKSECEKSIIKTLQSQHEQFTVENRRRAERNESILRMLERIDYQASSLAAKTERLRALKHQYEKHLLSLLNCRQHGISAPPPPAHITSNQFASPFARRYDESSAYQSSHYEPIARGFDIESNHSRSARFAALPPPYVNYPSLSYPLNNQSSSFRAMPSMLADNSIKSSNYRTTGAIIEPQLSYPPHRVRCDDLMSRPPYQQSVESESFHRSDNAINMTDVNPPTTINSIYSQQPARHIPWQLDEKFTAPSASQPIYQRNNVPLENHNYNSEDLKVSDALYGKPLIIPAVAPASQLSPSPNVRMSDGESESDAGEKCNLPKRNIRRSDSVSDDTYCQSKEAPTVPEVVGKQHDLIDNSRSTLVKSDGEIPREATEMNRDETRSINDSESTIVGNFVIPRIIVETQIDLNECPPHQTMKAKDDSSAVNNNLPLEEAASAIYHYDKQPLGDEEEQRHQQQPAQQIHEATRAVTQESEIKTDNSSAGGINNLDDDTAQGAAAPVALNDKINEIYRKIEKIEDKYYGEKEKIIEDFESKMSPSSLADAAVFEIPPMIDSSTGLKSDAAEIDSPRVVEGEATGEASNNESLIYGGFDEHQSENAPAWNDSMSHEIPEPKYNYEEQQIEGENQIQPTFVEGDDYSQQPSEFDNQYYAQQEPYAPESYALDPNAQQQPEQPSEFGFSQDEVVAYHPQSDSNYQQSNYEEAAELPSNYANDSAGVYYDYDQNQQPQQSEVEQIMYDDQNYAHQQQPEYADYTVEDGNKVDGAFELQPNENNYGFVENANETSGDDGTLYNANEYQTDALAYESQTTDETTVENANYPSQSELESNETFEQTAYEHDASYERDESFATTTTASNSTNDGSRAAEIEATSTSVNREALSQPSKSDDVKFVKQLLDSESDEATTRSNLLQTAIKEEADESDFDISTTS